MLRKVYAFDDLRKEPISYNEFEKIGMTKNEYLTYIKFCDELRSAMIIQHHFYYHNFENKRENAENILEIIWDQFLSFLQKFCLDDLDIRQLGKKNIPLNGFAINFTTYNGWRNYLDGDFLSPENLYLNLDTFRIYFEYAMTGVLNDRNVFDVEIQPEKPYLNYSLQEITVKMEQKHDYETYDKEPVFPVNSGFSVDIYHWAEIAERYCEHKRFIEDYDEIEDYYEMTRDSEFDQKKHTLYIYTLHIKCINQHHNVKPVTAKVKLPANEGMLKLNVQYCYDCKKFFINEESYNIYQEKYHVLPIYFRYVTSNGQYPNLKERSEKSPLRLCGYCVDKNSDLSKEKRQSLLSSIIEGNVFGLNKVKIINHLEMLIETNGKNKNMNLATEKWKEDLDFVLNYKMDKQSNVLIDDIVMHKQ